MPRIRRSELLLIAPIAVLGGCGWLPPDSPAQPKPVVDADIAQLAHAWKVDAHVLATKTNLSEGDATNLHGRTVTVGAANYSTPWHGTCEEANREKRGRALGEIATDVDLSQSSGAAVRGFGLVDPIVEYRLSCKDLRTRVPALTIFVGGTTAMTCFGGVCYMLKR